MEKLLELANAGVEVNVNGPYQYSEYWRLFASRETEGLALKIETRSTDLAEAINELYEKWVRATSHGLPAHTLRQITHE